MAAKFSAKMAAMPHSIKCADCGAPYETKRKNTKFCRICRINRNLAYTAARQSACWKCEEKFAPFDAGQVHCGKCCYQPTSCEIKVCALCKQEAKMIHPGLAVCWACALSPEKRRVFSRALTLKVEKRAVMFA